MQLLMDCMEEEGSLLMLADGHVQVEMEEEKEAQRASKKKTEDLEAEVVEEITQSELSQLGKGPQSEEVQEQEDLEQEDQEQEDQEL